MTKAEQRVLRNAFKVLEGSITRNVRHLEQSIAKLDVGERENSVELRREVKAIRRELADVRRTGEETNRHAKFTSSRIETLARSLEQAGVIAKLDEGKSGTAYSQVLNPKGRDRSR